MNKLTIIYVGKNNESCAKYTKETTGQSRQIVIYDDNCLTDNECLEAAKCYAFNA